MARVLLPIIGRSAIQHIVFLRSIYCEFQKLLHPHMAWNTKHYMFAGFSCLVMTRDLLLMLSRLFKSRWGFKRISVGEWRQIMVFVFQRNNLVFQQEVQSTVADQMGHLQSMHNEHYGEDKSFPNGRNDHVFQLMALISAKYHVILGFPPTLLQAIHAGWDAQIQILHTVQAVRQGRYIFPGQEVIAGQTGIQPEPALTAPCVSHAIMQDVVPPIILHVKRAVAQGMATLANIAFPHSPIASSRPMLTCVPHISLLVKLWEYLTLMGDHRPNRGFTNCAQGDVTQLMWEGNVNIAYIAFTSASSVHCLVFLSDQVSDSGKGMLSALSAMMECECLTTLYIVPLITMQEQLSM